MLSTVIFLDASISNVHRCIQGQFCVEYGVSLKKAHFLLNFALIPGENFLKCYKIIFAIADGKVEVHNFTQVQSQK